jgi:hypothetical protein
VSQPGNIAIPRITRKYEQAERADHFHRTLVGAPLSPQQPAVAHIIAEGAQSIPHVRAEFD